MIDDYNLSKSYSKSIRGFKIIYQQASVPWQAIMILLSKKPSVLKSS
jgi:hypothetical protein